MKKKFKNNETQKYISLILFTFLLLFPTYLFAKINPGFIINETYDGFKLIQEKNIQEIHSIARVFEHMQSGAKLIHLENDDSNKVFSITFKTPPSDDTGVPHILEHSVLVGSERFPVKSPLIEMSKGSLSTFLNALTYSDHTSYPIASRNHKDFRNLMHVYLDAVFYPNIKTQKEIFMQEGWHYELNSLEEDIHINGVVYNEMKGAYSNPYNTLYREIQKSLFPDSPYQYDSGGDPTSIVSLNYEKFMDFYNTYYHPSNSFIYLYGDLDLSSTLHFINESYLSKFNRKKINSSIPKQESFTEKISKVAQYSLPKDADIKNKSYLSLNYVIDEIQNKETTLGFLILDAILTQKESSPLRKVLLDKKIGANIYGTYHNMQLQPIYSIIVENAQDENIKQFEPLVQKTLKNVVEQGIDRQLIYSIMNSMEITMGAEKSNVSRGLDYNNSILLSWLYGYDPTLYLSIEKEFDSIKNKIANNYFENLIKNYLLENSHSSFIQVKPVAGLDTKKQESFKNALKNFKENLSENQLKKMINETKNLKKWKDTPNSKKAMNTLPSLSLEDLNQERDKNLTKKEKINGTTLLHHPLYTNKIAYMNLYFDTTKVPQEKIPYISLLASLLGNMNTKNYTYEQLSNKIDNHLGSLKFSHNVFSDFKDHKKYYPKFIISSYTLTKEVKNFYSLLEEILYTADFENIPRLKQLILQSKANLEYTLNNDGLSMSQMQLIRKFSNSMEYFCHLNGLDYYHFLCNIEDQLEENPQVIVENLKEISNFIFQKENLILGITVDEEEYEKCKSAFIPFENNLRKVNAKNKTYVFETSKDNQGIINGEKIQYVSKGYNFKDLGYEYSGKMDVLNHILSTNYLWNQVRVQGGAYGGFSSISNTGDMVFSSYRDPNIKETLSTYDGIPKYLDSFKANEKEMLNYIIGTLGKFDPLLSPQEKGFMEERLYITNTSKEDLSLIKEQILDTKSKDIQNYAKLIKDVLAQNHFTVVGNETKIQENAYLFHNILHLSKNKTKEISSYFPVRETFEQLGAIVTWENNDSKTPIISIKKDTIKIFLFVNTNKAIINGSKYILQKEIKIKNSKAFVSEEFIKTFYSLLQK